MGWDDDVVGSALSYESRHSCLKRRSACRGNRLDQKILGTDRADRIAGGGGDDLLEGAKGSDFLSGGARARRALRPHGDDTLLGSDELEAAAAAITSTAATETTASPAASARIAS